MPRVFRENGLSIVLLALFVVFWVGQSVAGHREHNSDQREHMQPEVAYFSYLQSAHFWEATAENWESEFLQMFGYVILTALLYQKGSSESKKPDEPEPVDRDPRRHKRRNAPWPVRRGGLILKLYENSLSLAFLLFFLITTSRTQWRGRAYTTTSRRPMASPNSCHFCSTPAHLDSGSSHCKTGRASSSPSRPWSFCRSTCGSAARRSQSRSTPPTKKPVAVDGLLVARVPRLTCSPARNAGARGAGRARLSLRPDCSPGS